MGHNQGINCTYKYSYLALLCLLIEKFPSTDHPKEEILPKCISLTNNTRQALGEVHSLSFVVVGAIRGHFRSHLTEITRNFVEDIYSINPSIKRDSYLQLENKRNNISGRKSKNKTRDYSVKAVTSSYFK